LDLLALHTRINVATLSRAERRLQSLSAEQKQRLGAFFGVDPNLLLEDASKAAA
jgi:hypothetical protein